MSGVCYDSISIDKGSTGLGRPTRLSYPSTDGHGVTMMGRASFPELRHRAADANSFQIRSSSQSTRPPGLSPNSWISAFKFSTISCSSERHCCWTLSKPVLCLANMARIHSLSINVNGIRGSSAIASSKASFSLILSILFRESWRIVHVQMQWSLGSMFAWLRCRLGRSRNIPKKGSLDIRPAATVEVGAEEATCG